VSVQIVLRLQGEVSREVAVISRASVIDFTSAKTADAATTDSHVLNGPRR
jgi:hypothetical protein